MMSLRTTILPLLLLFSIFSGCATEDDFDVDSSQAETQCTSTQYNGGENWCVFDYGSSGPKRHAFDRKYLDGAYEYFASLDMGSFLGSAKFAYVIAYDPDDAAEMLSTDSRHVGGQVQRALVDRGVDPAVATEIRKALANYFAYRIRFEYSELFGNSWQLQFDIEDSVMGKLGGAAFIWNACGDTLFSDPVECIGLVITEAIKMVIRQLADDLKDKIQRSNMNEYVKRFLIWAIDRAIRWGDTMARDSSGTSGVTIQAATKYSCNYGLNGDRSSNGHNCNDLYLDGICPQRAPGCGATMQDCHSDAVSKLDSRCYNCYAGGGGWRQSPSRVCR